MRNTTKLALGASVVLMSASAGAGCRSCNEAGCLSQINVRPHARISYDVCVDDRCTAVAAGTAPLAIPIADAGSTTLEVAVNGSDGSSRKLLVELVEFHPNGPRCAPTCHTGDVVLSEL